MNKLFKSKKAVMTASLIIGITMLSIPTFAELNSKTGYDKFKDSIKSTAEVLTNKGNNYTSEVSITVKDNDKVILSTSSKSKLDNAKDAMETTESNKEQGVETTRYYYRDSKVSISVDDNNTYHVSEYVNPNNFHVTPENPFNEDNASDIEKIVDAVLAGLKDNVIVTEKNDGNKEFSGTISENQVPALINTVSSYIFKTQVIGNRYQTERSGLPQVTNDIYIKNVTGKAVANKQGIVENLFATATLSGKEKDGTSHDITVEILMEVSDFNKTVVSQPDLTGKKVEKNVVQNNSIVADGSMFVGKYKNDIVIKENGKFVKVGERHIEILNGDSNTVEGKYYDNYLGDYGKNRDTVEFIFKANILENQNGGGEFTITNKSGKTETGHLYLNQFDGNINFMISSIQRNNELYDGNFVREFDK